MSSPEPENKFPLARVVLLALVAALLATTVWFGVNNSASRAKVAALETERDLAMAAQALAEARLKERTLLAEAMINELRGAAAKSSDLANRRVIRLKPVSPASGAGGLLLWYPLEKAGLLVVADLPALETDQAYELHLFTPSGGSVLKLVSFQSPPRGFTLVDFPAGALPDFDPETKVAIKVYPVPGKSEPQAILSN